MKRLSKKAGNYLRAAPVDVIQVDSDTVNVAGSSSSGQQSSEEAPSDATSISSQSAVRILVYQSVFSFLVHVSSATNTRVIPTLRGYYEKMSAEDPVSALVNSRESRTTLLKLSSDLGVAGDPKLRDALREDEERIATHILSILDSQSSKESVLKLTGDAAQYFLDVVQNAIDRGLLFEKEHNSKARRIILKLSDACDKLPSSLFITGVSGREEYPTFGGGFGDIYRASYAGKTVALKHVRNFQRDAEIRRIRLQFCREALVWQHLQHPYILPLIGIDRETFPSSLCMVSPWMEHGTVLKYLDYHGRANVDKLLSEIAQGLQYLHSCNIVHGDLRGANILITNEWSACLADFGLTSISDATAATHTSNRAGSIRWMAPEIIDPARFGHPQFSRTPASDVYAFGCVCLELYTGRPPFPELSEPAAMFRVLDGDRPAKPSSEPAISDALWQYITGYWSENSAKRPTTDVVVQDMAFNYVSWLATRFAISAQSKDSPEEYATPEQSIFHPDEVTKTPSILMQVMSNNLIGGFCHACRLAVEDASVVTFRQYFFHVACFNCARCRTRLGPDTLSTAGPAPICQNCSHGCKVCHGPILDDAITSGDASYHVRCFKCTICKIPVDLLFAKTNLGIYCIDCHNEQLRMPNESPENDWEVVGPPAHQSQPKSSPRISSRSAPSSVTAIDPVPLSSERLHMLGLILPW